MLSFGRTCATVELAVRLVKRQGIEELLGLYNVSIYISCRARGDLRGAGRLAR